MRLLLKSTPINTQQTTTRDDGNGRSPRCDSLTRAVGFVFISAFPAIKSSMAIDRAKDKAKAKGKGGKGGRSQTPENKFIVETTVNHLRNLIVTTAEERKQQGKVPLNLDIWKAELQAKRSGIAREIKLLNEYKGTAGSKTISNTVRHIRTNQEYSDLWRTIPSTMNPAPNPFLNLQFQPRPPVRSPFHDFAALRARGVSGS